MPHYEHYYQTDQTYTHPVYEPIHHEVPVYQHHEAPLIGESVIERYPGHQWTHEEPSHDHAFAQETDHQFGYLVHHTPLSGGDHDAYLGMHALA